MENLQSFSPFIKSKAIAFYIEKIIVAQFNNQVKSREGCQIGA
jgi:hypothetical protein